MLLVLCLPIFELERLISQVYNVFNVIMCQLRISVCLLELIEIGQWGCTGWLGLKKMVRSINDLCIVNMSITSVRFC